MVPGGKVVVYTGRRLRSRGLLRAGGAPEVAEGAAASSRRPLSRVARPACTLPSRAPSHVPPACPAPAPHARAPDCPPRSPGLLRLARSEDELAAVLAHESAHVVARHAAERITQMGAVEVARTLIYWWAAGAAGPPGWLAGRARDEVACVGGRAAPHWHRAHPSPLLARSALLRPPGPLAGSSGWRCPLAR